VGVNRKENWEVNLGCQTDNMHVILSFPAAILSSFPKFQFENNQIFEVFENQFPFPTDFVKGKLQGTEPRQM